MPVNMTTKTRIMVSSLGLWMGIIDFTNEGSRDPHCRSWSGSWHCLLRNQDLRRRVARDSHSYRQNSRRFEQPRTHAEMNDSSVSSIQSTTLTIEAYSVKMHRMLENSCQYRHNTDIKIWMEHTGLPIDPPGIEISITLLGGNVYTDPAGSRSVAVLAPLMICRRTGSVGGWNVAPLTKNFRLAKSKLISRLRLTSAAPGVGTPGAAALTRGWRLVSIKGLERIDVVVGSAMCAPQYRRIAEFRPPANPWLPTFGRARIQ